MNSPATIVAAAPEGRSPIERRGRLRVAPAAALEHATALRAQIPHIGNQTGLDPLLVRDQLPAEPERIILARLLFLLRIGGGGARENDHGQYKRNRDQLQH